MPGHGFFECMPKEWKKPLCSWGNRSHFDEVIEVWLRIPVYARWTLLRERITSYLQAIHKMKRNGMNCGRWSLLITLRITDKRRLIKFSVRQVAYHISFPTLGSHHSLTIHSKPPNYIQVTANLLSVSKDTRYEITHAGLIFAACWHLDNFVILKFGIDDCWI